MDVIVTQAAERTWRSLPPKYDGAASSTIEALMWELREYGSERLENENTKRRIADLTPSQMRQVAERLAKLQEKYPQTTSRELVAFFEELLKWQS
jgi:hypothetical protein